MAWGTASEHTYVSVAEPCNQLFWLNIGNALFSKLAAAVLLAAAAWRPTFGRVWLTFVVAVSVAFLQFESQQIIVRQRYIIFIIPALVLAWVGAWRRESSEIMQDRQGS